MLGPAQCSQLGITRASVLGTVAWEKTLNGLLVLQVNVEDFKEVALMTLFWCLEMPAVNSPSCKSIEHGRQIGLALR